MTLLLVMLHTGTMFAVIVYFWRMRQAEIDTLLAAPIHLTHLLIPLMLKHGRPGSIINVTSGGAFVPQVFAPIYSACKAALHSYTMTLRHALNRSSVKVNMVLRRIA